ncbi:hypothetical protein [Virgisporangium aurantiacum]|uniref:Uncharacterized protein n=1 Tax=Virgisporangium aurantiacum TaxID=175570 RepID=A0A8J4E1P1_9ACTN|nr:hypothetical protein Vau01_055190 [Virgisporangium aurantiacum]
MGGERRRRRLRRTGRTPFDAVQARVPEADPELPEAEHDTTPPVPDAAAVPDAADDTRELPVAEDRSADVDRRPRPPRPNGNSGRGPRPGPPQHRPSPADLADLSGPFALTAGVQDPDPPPAAPADHHHDHRFDDPAGERGLRGLVGGGSSQVNVVAAMRARDASRPTDDDLATAEAELPIVRRGWVPREDLPRTH